MLKNTSKAIIGATSFITSSRIINKKFKKSGADQSFKNENWNNWMYGCWGFDELIYFFNIC